VQGGNALAVDCIGVENIGRAAIAAGVPRLAVVSSVGVTRPDSLAFKFTNLFGNVMDYKEQVCPSWHARPSLLPRVVPACGSFAGVGSALAPTVTLARGQGEERLRALYAGQSALSYTVIRPGGLSNGKGVGIAGLQISQGDTAYTEVCAGPWAPASRACGVKRRAPSMECRAARGKRGVSSGARWGRSTGRTWPR